MTHTHVYDHPTTAESSVRQLRAVRLMVVVLIPIAIWTVVGLIWLWPHDVDAHIRQDTSTYTAAGVSLQTGEVTAVEPMSCQGQAGSTSSGSGQSDDQDCARITVRLLEGPEQGQQVRVVLTQAQYDSGVSAGQKVKLFRIPPAQGGQGHATYQFSDFVRTVPLIALAAVFALAVIAVGRWRGLGALVGLVFAGFILVEFLFPALVSGENPILVGLIGTSAIMFVVLYTAHGFSARTTTALVGTLFGLLLTAGLGWAMSHWAHLTGVAAEDDYLLSASAPDLTLTSVVLCGIIIAGLGVLNDVTITQASAVWELAESDPDQKKLFAQAMRIGRDHVASSVYTIAFATAGAGLSALLLITVYGRPLGEVAQTEALAEEIIRTLVGATGLVLAMPLTTAIGVAVVRTGRLRHRAESAPSDPVSISPAGPDPAVPDEAATQPPDVSAVAVRVRPTAATTAPPDDKETTRLPRIRRSPEPKSPPEGHDAGEPTDGETHRRSRRARDDESFNFSDLHDDGTDPPPGRRAR